VIDLHCHILPGVDDGPAELADSVAMAEQAAADGLEAVCATPHIRHDHDVRISELSGRVGELNAELERLGIPIRVIAAGEVAETAAQGLTDEHLRTVALGGLWVLLEPAPGPLSDSLASTADHLRDRGFQSLIAHPERHPAPDMARRLRELVDAGCLVQVTAALLAEGEASAALLALARRGLVHVLGSDSHSARFGRPLQLSAGFERLRELAEMRPHLEWIAEAAPAAIVRGEQVVPPFAAR
jgi:protein-tyrosine phosphatase